METQETKPGKVIGNVGILDIRKATPEAVAEIRRIDNVGVIFYAPETAYLLTRLNVGNVGATREIPTEARFVNGQQIFSRDSFKNQVEPLTFAVNGKVIFSPDIAEDELRQGLGQLVVNGKILCPEHLAGTIQARLADLNGRIVVYKGQPRLVIGNLTLTEAYLRALPDDAELMVSGKLSVPHLLPNDLLQQKLQRLQVIDTVLCREENSPALLASLDNATGTPRITIIPAGFEWIDHPLILDAGLLETLPHTKLYCTDLVQVDVDVDPEELDQTIDRLIVEDLLICPAILKSTIAKKCNLFETQAIFYEGELWLIETEFSLSASRFDFLEGQATLVVRGELLVDPDVAPKLLAERLDKVHNFGEIICTPPQRAAFQARLGLNKGEFVDPGVEEEEDGLGNVGHLKL